MSISALQFGGVLLKAEGGRRAGTRRGGAGTGAAAAAPWEEKGVGGT